MNRKEIYDHLETNHPWKDAYKSGMLHLNYYPFKIRIEPTNHCNLSCPYCSTLLLKKNQKGFMEMELYRKIVSEIKDKVDFAGLFFGGESLLHKSFIEMVEIAAAANLRPYLHTNGTKLNKNLADLLSKSGLDFISFSFDGFKWGTTTWGSEAYEENRLGAKYQKTLEKIQYFLSIKKDVYASIQIITTKRPSESDKQKIYKLFHGADEISYVPVHNWAGEFASSQKNNLSEEYIRCTDLWKLMVIGWGGLVFPCCRDLTREKVMGDVKESSVISVWNNEEFKNLRKIANEKRYLEEDLCRFCDKVRCSSIKKRKDYDYDLLTRIGVIHEN